MTCRIFYTFTLWHCTTLCDRCLQGHALPCNPPVGGRWTPFPRAELYIINHNIMSHQSTICAKFRSCDATRGYGSASTLEVWKQHALIVDHTTGEHSAHAPLTNQTWDVRILFLTRMYTSINREWFHGYQICPGRFPCMPFVPSAFSRLLKKPSVRSSERLGMESSKGKVPPGESRVWTCAFTTLTKCRNTTMENLQPLCSKWLSYICLFLGRLVMVPAV